MLGVATRSVRTSILFFIAVGTLALAEPSQLPLPKCDIPLGELAVVCKGALVATLVSVDWEEFGPTGASIFQSHWKVINTLRGNYPGNVEMTFIVQTFPKEHRQRKPTLGQTYILISHPENETSVAYIFDHTVEKLREIQQLLSAKSK